MAGYGLSSVCGLGDVNGQRFVFRVVSFGKLSVSSLGWMAVPFI